MSLGPIDQNASKDVVAAVNELTERDLNIHVNISWYDAATYGTQVPMKIQANEKQDIIMFTPVPTASYTSYRAANQLMDISDLIDEYAPTSRPAWAICCWAPATATPSTASPTTTPSPATRPCMSARTWPMPPA